jgi:hypothetical protein
MRFYIILAFAAAATAAWNIATSIRICGELRRRDMKASFLWLRSMAPIYAHRYKKVTTAETGKPGPMYWQWVVSINLTLVLAVAAILFKLRVP